MQKAKILVFAGALISNFAGFYGGGATSARAACNNSGGQCAVTSTTPTEVTITGGNFDGGYALRAKGAGNIINASNVNVTSTLPNTYGAWASGGGTINLVDANFTGWGSLLASSDPLLPDGPTLITMDGGSIHTSNFAIRTGESTATKPIHISLLGGVDISTTASNSANAIWIYGHTTLSYDDGSIVVYGSGRGITADNEAKATLSNVTIETQGSTIGNYGVEAVKDAALTLNKGL